MGMTLHGTLTISGLLRLRDAAIAPPMLTAWHPFDRPLCQE
jgi:hypothetical protein